MGALAGRFSPGAEQTDDRREVLQAESDPVAVVELSLWESIMAVTILAVHTERSQREVAWNCCSESLGVRD